MSVQIPQLVDKSLHVLKLVDLTRKSLKSRLGMEMTLSCYL